jgi:hypothetical protein
MKRFLVLSSTLCLVTLTTQLYAQYCISGATSTADSRCEIVQLSGNTITLNNNSSTSGCVSYTDYTSGVNVPDMTAGGSYTVNISNGSCGGTGYTRWANAWIDFNNDGDFTDANEMLGAGTVSSNINLFVHVINFTVPAGATIGNTTMRVIVKESGAATDPCANTYTWGETEDYSVTILSALPMAYSSSACTQPTTTDVENCATDQEIIRIEVVTTGSASPIDMTQFRIRTDGTSFPLLDIDNIDIYYTGASTAFSNQTLFGSGAAALAGINVIINGTQTLLSGSNYFWVAYDITPGASAGNLLDAECRRFTVAGNNYFPLSPAGNRTLIACARTCPANANIYTDDFESGAAVAGVIPGTTYGSIWTGLPHTGTYHAWLNIQNGLSNIDVFERRFDGYYMGCDVTFDYWYLHNSVGFDAEYILLDDNNNIIDFQNVITTALDVNVYQNRIVTFTPTTTGITLRIHVNSTGGAGMDIAFDDFNITQCCTALLPVDLLSFNAKCDNNKVVLDWVTISEINNDYFTIERTSGGIHFEEIATVNGNGNSSTLMNYEWIDQNPINGTAYYRLKQTDFNGSFEYHDLVPVTCESAHNMTVSPNPIKNSFTVQVSESLTPPLSIEVIDFLGRTIYLKNIKTSIAEITLDEELPTGTYFVKVFNENAHVIEKVVKIN